MVSCHVALLMRYTSGKGGGYSGTIGGGEGTRWTATAPGQDVRGLRQENGGVEKVAILQSGLPVQSLSCAEQGGSEPPREAALLQEEGGGGNRRSGDRGRLAYPYLVGVYGGVGSRGVPARARSPGALRDSRNETKRRNRNSTRATTNEKTCQRREN